jgi:HSP20 family protein
MSPTTTAPGAAAAVAKAPATTPEKKAPAVPARPHNPFDLMRSLTDEMDRAFSGFWNRHQWPFSGKFLTGTPEVSFTPPIEMEEREGRLYVRTDLPGLTKEDVKVEVAEDVLTIEGERKQESEKNEKDYYRSERSYGYFCRQIALPEGVNADTAKATFKDGVLEIAIDLPVRKAPETQRIAIGD